MNYVKVKNLDNIKQRTTQNFYGEKVSTGKFTSDSNNDSANNTIKNNDYSYNNSNIKNNIKGNVISNCINTIKQNSVGGYSDGSLNSSVNNT